MTDEDAFCMGLDLDVLGDPGVVVMCLIRHGQAIGRPMDREDLRRALALWDAQVSIWDAIDWSELAGCLQTLMDVHAIAEDDKGRFALTESGRRLYWAVADMSYLPGRVAAIYEGGQDAHTA